MRKSILFFCGLALLATGCGKEMSEPLADSQRHITVDISVDQDGPATRAVQSGWRDGDKIFVVFDYFFTDELEIVKNPYFMTLTYNGGAWTSEFSDVALEEYLLGRDSGYLTAAYFSDGEPVFMFQRNDLYFELKVEDNDDGMPGFFLSAEAMKYTVKDQKLTATLKMELNPDSFVHFFIDGIDETKAGNYTFFNKDIQSCSFDRFYYVKMEEAPYPFTDYIFGPFGGAIRGTYYDGGVRFCGCLNDEVWDVKQDYSIRIVDNNGTPDDYYDDIFYRLTNTATLEGKDAVKLPPLDSDAWVVDDYGTINGYEYVDMGGEIVWAVMNIGASCETEYGEYFAWGETEPKEVYNSSTYYGDEDIDIAAENWGEAWRIPSKEEYEWLLDESNCTNEWVSDYDDSGINGRLFTSLITGGTLFFPATGFMRESRLEEAGSNGYYWSSTLDNDGIAWYFRGGKNSNGFDHDGNQFGTCVRAVSDK